MEIQTACRALSATDLRRPKCPSCGSVLLVAEHSTFNADGGIRHNWSCDECGREFTTSIRVLPRQA
jgi:ribosomal protein S27AE